MRRSKELVELSRRDFCGFACVSLVAACTPGSNPVSTGPLGGGDDDDTTGDASSGGPDGPSGGGPDASTPPHDAGMTSPDASMKVACTTTSVDVGAAATFAMNAPVYNASAKAFVVRDAQGLFAVSAKCTHEGQILIVQNGYLYCTRHGAKFKYDGTIVSGPVTKALAHFAMCDSGNDVAVEPSVTVATSQRLGE